VGRAIELPAELPKLAGLTRVRDALQPRGGKPRSVRFAVAGHTLPLRLTTHRRGLLLVVLVVALVEVTQPRCCGHSRHLKSIQQPNCAVLGCSHCHCHFCCCCSFPVQPLFDSKLS